MRKKSELALRHTCMNDAHEEEMVFVLLSRDAAAPVAIRAWVAERLRLKKNIESDAQIIEALECALTMESEGRKWADIQTCDATIQGFAPGICKLLKKHKGEHRTSTL